MSLNSKLNLQKQMKIKKPNTKGEEQTLKA